MVLSTHHEFEWRYETKFVLTQEDELRFLDWLASTPDFSRAYATRQVNSVYLDSLDYDCATANLSGLGWRSKFRFRWYGSKSKSQSTNFEIKQKRGRMGSKQICPVHIDHFEPFNLSKTDIDQLLRQGAISEHIAAPLSDLHPVLYVGYERDYFQGANGVRMTLDKHLSFQDLSNDQGEGIKQMHQDSRPVLEFKFPSDQKDQVAETMVGLPFSATRSSKYVLGLAHTGRAVYF